jgi:hypothetical protein
MFYGAKRAGQTSPLPPADTANMESVLMSTPKAGCSRSLSLLALLAMALPAVSQADTLDYSWAELGYVDSEFGNLNGDGISLRGSLPVNDTFFVFASYWDVGYDFNVDLTSIEAGGGVHLPFNDKVHLVGRFGLVKSEFDSNNSSSDDDGFTFGAHVRAELMPKLEVEGGFDYIDLGMDPDTLLIAQARYFFLDNVSGGLRLEFGDDIDSMSLGVRVTF